MKRFGLAVLLTAFALSSAMAQGTCQSRAIDKNGKPLAGAALNSFMTKCAKDSWALYHPLIEPRPMALRTQR